MAESGSNRPSDSSFYNQRLKAWHPILTPKWVITSFAIVGVIFLPIGAILLNESSKVRQGPRLDSKLLAKIAYSDGLPMPYHVQVVEVVQQYDGDGSTHPDCHIRSSSLDNQAPPCFINFTTAEEMKAPVYVYYELDNFYQNHRRYVKSRSDSQLEGEIESLSDLADCDPLKTGFLKQPNGDPKVLHPCGLIANSYFNDTFDLVTSGIDMLETDISWESDREFKFKALPEATKAANMDEYQFINQTYPDVEDVTNEHFIVWMRTAALPNFRKLYGRIEQDIPKSTQLSFRVGRNFVVSTFDGKKKLVLSTTSWVGGKNSFLGIAYIIVGGACLLLALLFRVKEVYCPRKPGDVKYLRWSQR